MNRRYRKTIIAGNWKMNMTATETNKTNHSELGADTQEEYITEKVGMQMQEDAESFMEYSIE